MFRTSILFPLFAPTETPTDIGGDTGGLDKEETIKFFEDDTDDSETIELDRGTKEADKKGSKEKESEKSEDKEEDEETEETDDEETEDEEDEEEDELEKLLKEAEEDDKEVDEEEIPEPPRRKEILAKYPKLFKEFPALEKAYYREQQFTELFPTMKDAKEAAAKATALEGFETELRSGKIEPILSVIQKHDENAFNTMVDDLIPTLLKVNEKAGYHVISNIIKDTIVTMVKTGKKNDNKELLSAAKELNKFMFASEDFEPPTRLGKETTEEEKDKEDPVKKREQDLIRRQFEKTRDDLNTRVDKILRKTIDGNIDPRGSMTDYVRKNATREALEQTTDLISKDKRFRQVLDKLWEKAIKSDFKEEDVNRINAAYISKAKTVLPSVIKKARQEALKGMGKRVKEEETEETREPEDTTPRKKKRDAAPSNTRGQDSEKERARKIPANVSTKDYLMAD